MHPGNMPMTQGTMAYNLQLLQKSSPLRLAHTATNAFKKTAIKINSRRNTENFQMQIFCEAEKQYLTIICIIHLATYNSILFNC